MSGFGSSLANLFSGNKGINPAPASNINPTQGTPAPNPDAAAGLQQSNPAADPANKDLNLGVNPDGTPKKDASSPLDAFTDVFKIDPNKQPAADPLKDPLFSVDPQKLSAAVSKMDFTRAIKPELVQKALAGDPAAFSAAINQATQTAYMAVTQMMTGLMETAFSKNNGRFESTLSGKFRDFQISHSRPDNKVLQHPAAQPMISALKTHIASQYPDLGPQEVTKRAEDYFLAMSKELNTLDKDAAETAAAGGAGKGAEPDWTKYLET